VEEIRGVKYSNNVDKIYFLTPQELKILEVSMEEITSVKFSNNVDKMYVLFHPTGAITLCTVTL
jgi:hypothetical protein